MDKHQSPTVQHREPYSISCDKPQWKRTKCIITESLRLKKLDSFIFCTLNMQQILYNCYGIILNDSFVVCPNITTLLFSHCLSLCNPMSCSTPGSSVLHYLLEFAQIPLTQSTEQVMLSNHLILCLPLLLLSSVIPSIKIFSNESAVHRWPKY